ncbi:aminoacyltransferase [Candidatus Saccharibacteria bacterium]|nr:aminoacyltransferase [Candidatus Saccharibacteria bacterium]
MKEISAIQYTKSAHPTSFMQTAQMAQQRQACGQTVYFFQDKNEFALVNGTPYPKKTSKYYKYNIWFPNHLSANFIKQLRGWCKTHHGLSLTITPNTPVAIRDYHGKIIKKLDFDKSVFTNNNFKWHGNILTAPGTFRQWQYIVNLDHPYPELLKSFKPKVRHSITATQKTGLTVEPVTTKNFPDLIKNLNVTANRRHYSERNQEYYAQLLAAFKGDAYGLLVYLDPAKTRKLLQDTIKNSKNIKDGADIIKKAQRQLDIIKDLKHKTPICTGLFIDAPHETVYFVGGGPDQYFPFSPVYAIIDHAMQRSIKKQIPRFNLYGVDATFDQPTGLLRFKQQYHGFIEQLPCDYTATFHPLTTLGLKVKNRLKI